MTPGPWRVSPYYKGGLSEPPSGFHILRDDGQKRGPSNAALHALADVFAADDARLIAASYDMLKALQYARTCVPFPSDAHDKIVAAIAKATGEQP